MYRELQAFRVSAGWTITRHLFFEGEIDPETMDTVRETLFCAVDEGRRRNIDLEWVPENADSGYFELKVINITPVYNEHTGKVDQEYDWDTPHYKLQTTDRQKVVDEIERLMWQTPILAEERILKTYGVVDEPSESFRLRLKNEGPDKKLLDDILTRGNRKIQNLLIEHPDIKPEMLRTVIASSTYKNVKKKAEILLNSKRYKKAHGLWTKENPSG
ncbi:MAG: hypothetical protein Roseis2KO_28010 [Roseivirga sp.]